MAHSDWCGKPCGECITPCGLDESIPCSPDCPELLPDGSIDLSNPACQGCDVWKDYDLYA
jgi:hypothetical protein